MDQMEQNLKALYEKIGRQEVVIEGLKGQMAALSSLVGKLVSGEEKIDDWEVTPQGQLVRKAQKPAKTVRARK